MANFLCKLVKLAPVFHELGYAPQFHLVDSRPPSIGDWITSWGTAKKVTAIEHWPKTGKVSGYCYEGGSVCAGFADRIVASTNAFLELQPLPQEVIDAYYSTDNVLGISVDYNENTFQLVVGTQKFSGFDPYAFEKQRGPDIIWNDGTTSMLTPA